MNSGGPSRFNNGVLALSGIGTELAWSPMNSAFIIPGTGASSVHEIMRGMRGQQVQNSKRTGSFPGRLRTRGDNCARKTWSE